MKIGKRTIVILAIFLMTLVATTFALPLAPFLLTPHGCARVALRSINGGSATWYANAPIVYDGSFSVRLKTGSTQDDGAGIYIGPLDTRLRGLKASDITFWAFNWNNITMQPYVNLVLDNGRIMEGVRSTNVTGPMNDFVDQGYPSADLWVQMKATDQFYTSFPADPLLVSKGLNVYTLVNPAPMATWQTAFPTAKVVQIQIVYGLWDITNLPLTIYIDNVKIGTKLFQLEPETISSVGF